MNHSWLIERLIALPIEPFATLKLMDPDQPGLGAKPFSSDDDSERALGIARLVGLVEGMVKESGDPTGFDAAQWVAQWLEEPMAALGGKRPADLMDTAEGQAIVSNLISRMQSGAYA